MELKEFVAESIKQIVDGLVEANDYILEKTNSSEGVRSDYKTIFYSINFRPVLSQHTCMP